jgi:V/A-type H+-transporting ATPase subunit D
VETMAFIGRISATRGALIKLRKNLELIQNGKNVLKIKRDRLVAELNNLLNELPRRKKIEEQLAITYTDLKGALASLGYSKVSSSAQSISKIEAEVIPVSFMGVVSPKIMIKERPKLNSIQNIGLYEVAENLQNLIDELLYIAQIEAKIEKIAYELIRINRKVNALEKVIIPEYAKQIKYIEDILYDEDLEDFDRTKHVRNIIGRKNYEIPKNHLFDNQNTRP